jgi:multidrug efflux pump subunit AcrA (membrane-fusion protein)
LAGLAAVLVLTAASCRAEDDGIEVGGARRATVTEIVDAPASVVARAAATLTAPADGTLATLAVRSGDQVLPGQVLAVIDSPGAQARLAQATQALEAARRAGGSGLGRQADLSGIQRVTDAAAESAFSATRQAAEKIADPALRQALLAQVAVAQRQYTEASRAAAEAVASVQRGVAAVGSALGALAAAQRLQAQQAYDLAKSTVDALTLRAPIAGVVQLGGAGARGTGSSLTDLLGGAAALGGSASTAAGAQLTGGQTAGAVGGQPPAGVSDVAAVGARLAAGSAVLTVVDVSELSLVAEVDETDVLLVAAGVTAAVELDAAPGASYQATVRSIDLLPTPSARGGVAYRVRLGLGAGRFPDGRQAPAPRPGMSAVAHLQVRQAVDAVAVPAAAVFTVDGQDSVWVIRDGRARRVAVTVGVPGQDLVQIISGLDAGDRVVMSGIDQVSPGQQVS